jgi:hypothetical protein
MARVFLALLLGVSVAGCATLKSGTEGASGPLSWYITDPKRTEVTIQEGAVYPHGVYSFTLVLKEDQGKAVTFTHRKDRIFAAGMTQLSPADHAIHFRLQSYEERRFPFTFSYECGVDHNCVATDLGSVAPIWNITLTGTNDDGNPAKALIRIKLPDNPDTFQRK